MCKVLTKFYLCIINFQDIGFYVYMHSSLAQNSSLTLWPYGKFTNRMLCTQIMCFLLIPCLQLRRGKVCILLQIKDLISAGMQIVYNHTRTVLCVFELWVNTGNQVYSNNNIHFFLSTLLGPTPSYSCSVISLSSISSLYPFPNPNPPNSLSPFLFLCMTFLISISFGLSDTYPFSFHHNTTLLLDILLSWFSLIHTPSIQ